MIRIVNLILDSFFSYSSNKQFAVSELNGPELAAVGVGN